METNVVDISSFKMFFRQVRCGTAAQDIAHFSYLQTKLMITSIIRHVVFSTTLL